MNNKKISWLIGIISAIISILLIKYGVYIYYLLSYIFDFILHNLFNSQEGIDLYYLPESLKIISYSIIFLLLLSIIIGLLFSKKGFLSLASIVFFLPGLSTFFLAMSSLYGITFLLIIWSPLIGNDFSVMESANIIFLPLYPFSIINLSERILNLFIYFLGFWFFLTGTITYIYSKIKKIDVIDFGIYKYIRHPQYVGWIFIMYAIVINMASLGDVIRGTPVFYASLPFSISALVILALAWIEEKQLMDKYGATYISYMKRSYFLFPFPKVFITPHDIIFMKGKFGIKIFSIIVLYLLVLVVSSKILSLSGIIYFG